jgi:hypothetical protein
MPPPAGEQRDLVFISYSHQDRDWLDRLLVFLKPFAGPNFKVWADPHIRVGEELRRDITGVLAQSCVGVLLVSPDFLASDFIRNEELPPLLEGAEAGAISLFPIPISASKLQGDPADALPVCAFPEPAARYYAASEAQRRAGANR